MLTNMPKTKIKKSLIRPVHLQTIIVLVAYFIIPNLVFVGSVVHPNIYVSFFVPFIFGLLSSFVFLYLFGHKDFFHFIGNLESDERKNEERYLDKFNRYGSLVVCILVSAFGGPIFLALTIRFVFRESENRYLMTFISTLISTIFMVAFAKGLFNFVFRF